MNEAFQRRVRAIADALGFPIKSEALSSVAAEIAKRLGCDDATVTGSQIRRELADLRLVRPFEFEFFEYRNVSP